MKVTLESKGKKKMFYDIREVHLFRGISTEYRIVAEGNTFQDSEDNKEEKEE